MELGNVPHVRIPARADVLLIFMPTQKANPSLRATLFSLADSLQKHFGDQIRVLKIDQATQPDVFQSFAITNGPAFILIRQGVEYWRQVSMPDETIVAQLTQVLSEP